MILKTGRLRSCKLGARCIGWVHQTGAYFIPAAKISLGVCGVL
jgi:hypothetical protein